MVCVMGCDIHMYLEVKKPKMWVFPGKWEMVRPIDIERNYTLFAALCGVRSFIKDPVCVSLPKGIPKGMSRGVKDMLKEKDQLYDLHGHSHNTVKELKAFGWHSYGKTVESFLRELAKMGKNTRIVYFFDN